MACESEYKQKLVSAAEAVRVVKSGDVVDYGFFNGKPIVCDEALAARASELEDVCIYGAVTLPPIPQTAMNPKSFTYVDVQFSKLTRMLAQQNPRIYYMPVLYHMIPQYLKRGIGPVRNVGIIQVCPMDRYGYFNLGPQNSETLARLEQDEVVIVEVCKNMPKCLGGAAESIHISKVDYVVEAPEDQTLFAAPDVEITDIDKQIASLLMPYIEDGSCIQLGIGGLPNAVGKLIASSDLKDLGGHTEMLADAYVDMIESKKMTGARKEFDRNRVAYTFAIGTQRLYDFMHENPAIASYPVDYTNDPRIICRHDNFISICNAVQVDLYGQVNAESDGKKQISGNGGMWDFVLGSQWSKNGKSFICLSSTFVDKDGTRHSRIVPSFPEASIVTIPRQMVDFIATEYGVVRLGVQPVWTRAEALISIAHPDFQDDLIRQAQQLGIWRQSNKKA